MEKVIVFGDLHGNANLLKKFIKKVKKEYGNIQLWSVGDLVDRGGNEKEVIDICIKENIKAVVGNHDLWIVDLITNQTIYPRMIEALSAYSTLESYGVEWDKWDYEGSKSDLWSEVAADFLNSLPDSHISYFLNMYDAGMISDLDDKIYWIFHSGLTVDCAKRHFEKDEKAMVQSVIEKEHTSILWNRPEFKTEKDNLYKFKNGIQIFGHSYTEKPIVKKHFVALDTIGGGWKKKWTLSGIVLPDMKIIQVTE